MNRKILIGISGVVFLIILYFLVCSKNDESDMIKKAEANAKKAALAANPSSREYRNFADTSVKMFIGEPTVSGETIWYTYSQIIEMARTGRLHLVTELWKLRGKCPPDMHRAECNLHIEAFIREHYQAPDNEKLLSLFQKYTKYEDEMMRLKIPSDLKGLERLDFLKKKRRELFSLDEANMVFGLDEANLTMAETGGDFLKNTANLSGNERIKKYNELRKKTLGEFYDAVVEAEPKYTQYETEMMLRETDYAKSADKNADINTLREKYFGKEAAIRMAKVETEINDERKRIDGYEASEKKYLADNPNVSDADRQKNLRDMRVKTLGAEEADAYERRMEYENYLKKNNLK